MKKKIPARKHRRLKQHKKVRQSTLTTYRMAAHRIARVELTNLGLDPRDCTISHALDALDKSKFNTSTVNHHHASMWLLNLTADDARTFALEWHRYRLTGSIQGKVQ